MRDYERVNGVDGGRSDQWNRGRWGQRRDEPSWGTRYYYGGSMQRPGESGWERDRGNRGHGEGWAGSGEGISYGQSYGYGRRDYEPSYEEHRYEPSYEGRMRGSYGRDYGWEGREPSGAWDRFKGEMREGWERLRGQPERDERGWARGYGERSGWNERPEPSFWDQTKREAREGWDRLKESFSGKGPKGYKRSDDRIREDVCDRLSWHYEVDASEIEVTVSGGDVTLAGKVTDRRAKRLAEDIAEEVPGVNEVWNQLRTSRATRSESSTRGDGNRTTSMQNPSSSQANATR